jgi:hypothetical protein
MAKKTPQTKNLAQLLVKIAVGEMVADNRGCSVGKNQPSICQPTLIISANTLWRLSRP